MHKTNIRRFAQAVLVMLLGVMLCGCRFGLGKVRQPGTAGGTSIARPVPPPMGAPVAPGMEGGAGWDALGTPVTPPAGAMDAEQSRRWEGMAVYFAYDRSTVGVSERPKLDTLAEYMKQNPAYSVVIEGHCDERGSAEYNRGLGERRALAVRDYLVNLGISESRLETLSFGKERPAVANASSESDHALNRRAEFVISVRR